MQRETSNRKTLSRATSVEEADRSRQSFEKDCRSKLIAGDSSGRIRCRPVDSDSDSGSDGLRRFAAQSAMARDINEERRFREMNRRSKKPKQFQPRRRTVEDDDELESSDQEATKAKKWRPKEGRPPEHMSRAVAAQQKKYNPLIELLELVIFPPPTNRY